MDEVIWTHSFCFATQRLNIILFSKEWHSFLSRGIRPKIRSMLLSANRHTFFARSLFCLCFHIYPVRRLNKISITTKSSLHHFMYAFKDIVSWYLIWLPDLRPPISALTALTTLKSFKKALHWLWLLEWLELLSMCDPRNGDKGGGL